MALVGRKFPNVTVDAISKSGENFRINVLEEALKNQSQGLLLLFVQQNYTLFKLL